MINIKNDNDLKEKLNKSITLPNSVESKMKEAYQQIRVESGIDNSKVTAYRKPKFKKWTVIAATFILMIATTVGVLAATGFFSKQTIQEETAMTYKFNIDYELTPGVFEIEPEYVPAGYEDNGEGIGKYSAGGKKWISAIVNNTTGLIWQGQELNLPAKLVEKTSLAGMEADILAVEQLGVQSNIICLFNPVEGYVVEIGGGSDTPLEELKKFADNLKIKRVADGEALTADEMEDIDKMMAEDEKRMAEMEAKLVANQERGLSEEELFDIGEESFTGTLYGDGSRTKDVGYTVTSVEYIDNLAGYDESNFRDYESIKPWLNEDGSLKPYLRTEYELELGGDIIEEKKVEQTLMKVTLKVKRYQESFDSDGDGFATELDGWLIPLEKRTDGSYTWNDKTAYSPADGQNYEMPQIIYFDKSENPEASDYSFFLRNIKPGEEIEYTLIYVVDADSKDTVTIEMPGYTTEDELRILHKTW